jgi:hypothetical protein
MDVTRKDAAAIIVSIAQGPRELVYAAHFWESSGKRGFTAQDVYHILRSHRLEPGPMEWSEKTGAFRVRLIGTCLEGRKTRLVLDLRADGPCTAVTIMEDTQTDENRRHK